MTITYLNDVDAIRADQLRGFFVGWPNPPKPDRHLAILKGSYKVWLAMDGDHCIGFINSISDGIFCSFIPLLEVLPDYQGRGIGSELVQRMLSDLAGHYSIDVVCDEGVANFYGAHGFNRLQAMARRFFENQDACSS